MKSGWMRLPLVLAGLVALNVLAGFVFFRWDLTQDRRYSLSEATENLLADLDQEVYVKVYLDGPLNPAFRQLKTSVQETLDELRTRSGRRLAYEFIDPSAQSDSRQRTALYESLAGKGLIPTNIIEDTDESRREQLLWPGAVLRYGDREVGVNFLKASISRSAQENINLSAENVEFTFASALRELTQKTRRKIGLLTTLSKQLPAVRVSDLVVALQKHYDVFQVNLQTSPNLDGLDAVMVIKPDQPLAEDDQLKLDQFIIHGGKALFLVDGVRIDTVQREGLFATPLDLGYNGLLFRYGVRLNPVLAKDLLSASIPLNVGTLGDKPNLQLLPWRFFPLLNDFGPSPITRNLDAVYARYASTLDTVQAPGIRKTALLKTSAYTAVLHAPAAIPFNEARQRPDPKTYAAGPQAVAYLLEGRFTSPFRGRLFPPDPRAVGFAAQDKPSKILVVADGDIALNDFDNNRQVPLPLGFDRFSTDRHTFSNREFLLNAVDYMLDDNGVITARNKDFKIRLLDTLRLRQFRVQYQLLNVAGPVLLIALLGGVWFYLRKKKYA